MELLKGIILITAGCLLILFTYQYSIALAVHINFPVWKVQVTTAIVVTWNAYKLIFKPKID